MFFRKGWFIMIKKFGEALREFKKGYPGWVNSNHEEESKIPPRRGFEWTGDLKEMGKALKALDVFFKKNAKLVASFPADAECGSPHKVEEPMRDAFHDAFMKHLGTKAPQFKKAMDGAGIYAVDLMTELKDKKLVTFYESVNALGVFFTQFVMNPSW